MFAFDGSFDNALETLVNSAIEVAEEPTVEVLSIRARDAENAWGPAFSVVVSIEPAITTSREIKVSAAEYYFNDDPGAGNGTAMLAVNGNFNNAIKALKGGAIPAPIEQGIHTLWMRARDAENQWGPSFGVVVNMDTTITGLNAQINGQIQFCQGDNLTGIPYSTPATGGSTYVWTSTNGAVVSGQGSPSVMVNWNPSGNRTLTLTQCLGADCQTETITLSVSPTYTINQSATICQGQSIFLGGANQTQPGAYTDVFQTLAGCDSTVVTTLSVVESIQVSQSAELCSGESLFVGGANQTSSGVYTDTYASVSGCDSVVTTTLTVLAPILVNESAQVCQGGSVFLAGDFQSTPGNYTEVFTSIQGCDSVVVTNLSIIPAPIIEETVAICPGQSYFVGGADQTEPGQYADTVTDVEGCETVVITTLLVESNVTIPQSVEVCAGQSYFVGGAEQTTSGVYTDSETDEDGCLITIETTLTVLPPAVQAETASICEGQSIFLGGAEQTTPGVYSDFIVDNDGCVVELQTTLSFSDLINVAVQAGICAGDSLFVGGGWQNTAGVYTDLVSVNDGCDSLITTTLTISPPVFNTDAVTFCQGDSLFVGGGWQFNTGSYADTYASALGCDSVVVTQLTVLAAPNPLITLNNGVLTTTQFSTYQWSLNGTAIDGATDQFFVPTQEGEYTVTVTNPNGCAGESSPFSFIIDHVRQLASTPSVVVHPNPGSGVFNVRTHLLDAPVLTVYDLTGRMVDASTQLADDGFTVDLRNHATGCYLFVVQHQAWAFRTRVMLVH